MKFYSTSPAMIRQAALKIAGKAKPVFLCKREDKSPGALIGPSGAVA